jgi:hypothetical protein
MIFEAQTKASAAMDVYKSMLDNANSHSKQMKNILSTQLSLYDTLNVDKAVNDIIAAKLNGLGLPEAKKKADGTGVKPLQHGAEAAAAADGKAGAAGAAADTAAGAAAKTAGGPEQGAGQAPAGDDKA